MEKGGDWERRQENRRSSSLSLWRHSSFQSNHDLFYVGDHHSPEETYPRSQFQSRNSRSPLGLNLSEGRGCGGYRDRLPKKTKMIPAPSRPTRMGFSPPRCRFRPTSPLPFLSNLHGLRTSFCPFFGTGPLPDSTGKIRYLVRTNTEYSVLCSYT